MAATVQDVRDLDLLNGFSTLSDAQVQSVLDCALLYINLDAFAGKGDKAQALLAAHFAAEGLAGDFAPSGPVTGEAAGGLSRSYGSSAGQTSMSSFASTIYGRRFLELLARCPFTPMVLDDC